MEISKVISLTSKPTLSSEELKKLTDFFSILIRIDQKKKAERNRNENITRTQKT